MENNPKYFVITPREIRKLRRAAIRHGHTVRLVETTDGNRFHDYTGRPADPRFSAHKIYVVAVGNQRGTVMVTGFRLHRDSGYRAK